MDFYTRHIFFCNNVRNDGKSCCSQLGAKQMYRYAKDKCRDESVIGEGKIGNILSNCSSPSTLLSLSTAEIKITNSPFW